MERTTRELRWKVARCNKPSQQQPSARWGHSSCVIRDSMLVFGGYADSNYMNDLWTYNSTTQQWTQVKTTGDIPENRSNCTMSYDADNDRVVIFGGGGSNKKRFNALSILDWKTKHWTEIKPKDHQTAPWERTYHSAELKFPYLIVFGGEGLADLDDLWVFNFETHDWKEVPNKNKIRPCARRFHSSAIIKDQMFIIGGCHSRYRSLSDVFSLDLSLFLKSGNIDHLEWKERKLDGGGYLARWGHSSSVFGDKIYIFGGRFSNDLNDLLVIDTLNNTLKSVKGLYDPPKARRRHSAGFMGSSLIVFGGFNGEYFNDMHYVTLNEQKAIVQKSQYLSRVLQMLNNPLYSDLRITDCNGKTVYLHSGVILNSVNHIASKLEALLDILKNLSTDQINRVLRYVYLCSEQVTKSSIFERAEKMNLDRIDYRSYFSRIKRNINEENAFASQNGGIIKVKEHLWHDFCHQKQEYKPADSVEIHLRDNQQKVISSKAILSVHSEYFSHLLNEGFSEQYQKIYLNQFDNKITKILIKYIETDIAVVPDTFEHRDWVELLNAAQFYNLSRLVSICQYQICNFVSLNNHIVETVFQFAIRNKLENLKNHCAETEIKSCKDLKDYEHFESIRPEHKIAKEMTDSKNRYFKLMFFDLQQLRLDSLTVDKKKLGSSEEFEKENNEINS